ncbi:YbcC family protein [Ekhidna sp. To15]|uniref:YbcC family protein n=1 Tax=Ekhidna sp. To15 TaxID=3395267 RepID=UPI003F51CB67
MSSTNTFREDLILEKLKHYLPAQAPLKDFVHHNTLHAFQDLPFEQAIRRASKIFGYKTSLSLQEYRRLYDEGKINNEILENVIIRRKGNGALNAWKTRLTDSDYKEFNDGKIGRLRALWKDHFKLDLNTIVHTNLFRILNSYLDQGIAITKFPVNKESFISSIIEIEKNSFVSFFKTQRAKGLLFDPHTSIESLLKLLVGHEVLYEQYLFDQQFAHPGWSGLIGHIEAQPRSLLDGRKISLKEMILLECLLEIDNLDNALGQKWKPLSEIAEKEHIVDILGETEWEEYDELIVIWQEAYEWTYYDQVLAGVMVGEQLEPKTEIPSFEAFFCIDDRECSIRRYIEHYDPDCATYGTPGHFAIDTFYQPKNGKFYSKVCPVPISPKHLIKEVSTNRNNTSDLHFNKSSHGLFRGWLISQTLGFWSAIKLMFNIFRPSVSPATSYSFSHMDSYSALTIENRSEYHKQDGLQIGYTVKEMADRVEMVLRSTGTTELFAPLVYMIGHGASSANNTHYAGYDCGACSGRPGSANARAFSFMANHRGVRDLLKKGGIDIPDSTEFIGGLHDTTRDEFRFFDEELLNTENQEAHKKNVKVFEKALRVNAKERSRRFMSIDTKQPVELIHHKVKERSVSLFEPRPELNHATNTLCVIGRKHINDHLFLDRRAFLNSYNYELDPDGKYLQTIINAAAPVCGGINLEYYFSRVDNEKLGAGSKLPHNVMGLIGVANGFEGDLRPGLPIQMVEVHDPLRLMIVIEHNPEVVLKTIQSSEATYEWFINEWVILTVVNPLDGKVYRFADGSFSHYDPISKNLEAVVIEDLNSAIESTHENLPVYLLK